MFVSVGGAERENLYLVILRPKFQPGGKGPGPETERKAEFATAGSGLPCKGEYQERGLNRSIVSLTAASLHSVSLYHGQASETVPRWRR